MNTLNQLVSVIIPTYNRASLIEDALTSVHEQNHRPIELIVVDDGSDDGTDKIVESWAKGRQSDQFKVKLVRQKNRGAPAARNVGLSTSNGQYIQFLDSDDLLRPQKLRQQIEVLKGEDADVVYGNTVYTDGHGGAFKMRRYPLGSDPWIVEHAWSTSSPLLRADVCEEVGPWNEELKGCQEYEYGARIRAGGYDIRFLDEVVDELRRHVGPSITRRDEVTYARSIEMAADLVHGYIKENDCGRSEFNRVARNLAAAGLKYARASLDEEALRAIRKARAASKGGTKVATTVLSLSGVVLGPETALEFGDGLADFLDS